MLIDVRECNRKCGCEMTSKEVGFTSSIKLTVDWNVVSEEQILTRKQ